MSYGFHSDLGFHAHSRLWSYFTTKVLLLPLDKDTSCEATHTITNGLVANADWPGATWSGALLGLVRPCRVVARAEVRSRLRSEQ